jgi:short-subunit dehydrogenase
MKILLTGASSGLGKALKQCLVSSHDVDAPNRQSLNLSDSKSITEYKNSYFDMLINCAATGVGGKIDFVNHQVESVQEILQTNLLGTVLLTQKVLQTNPKCKIVNITSTNCNQYWPNDLVYSLSKKALSEFNRMLQIEYPHTPCLEVRLGFTKTNFNHNRYKHEPERYTDIYSQYPYLTAEEAADKIVKVLFDDHIKFVEVAT